MVAMETITRNFNLIIVSCVGPGLGLSCHYGGYAEPHELCVQNDFEIGNF